MEQSGTCGEDSRVLTPAKLDDMVRAVYGLRAQRGTCSEPTKGCDPGSTAGDATAIVYVIEGYGRRMLLVFRSIQEATQAIIHAMLGARASVCAMTDALQVYQMRGCQEIEEQEEFNYGGARPMSHRRFTLPPRAQRARAQVAAKPRHLRRNADRGH